MIANEAKLVDHCPKTPPSRERRGFDDETGKTAGCLDVRVDRLRDFDKVVLLSAFTKRHDRQEIPYVLELLRCVGDQRATETAHRAWLLTRRDRADAIAEIRILVAHAEELAEL
jgi:hypothetical protein